MDTQLSLTDEEPRDDHHLVARPTDPSTSHLSSASTEAREGSTASFRPNTQKHRILAVYLDSTEPLTDTQAWRRAGISPRSGAWHRCSDLRDAGAIIWVDSIRDPETGQEVKRSTYTPFGEHVGRELKAGRPIKGKKAPR